MGLTHVAVEVASTVVFGAATARAVVTQTGAGAIYDPMRLELRPTTVPRITFARRAARPHAMGLSRVDRERAHND